MEEERVIILYSIHNIACEIRIIDNTVSRQHVRIVINEDYTLTNTESTPKVTISDMNTKHGTKWNGQRWINGHHIIDRIHVYGHHEYS